MGSDGGNLSVPLPREQITNNAAPWPHQDQSPLKPGLASIQGLINLLPNGPDDGGLAVMTNSVQHFSALYKAFDNEKVRCKCNHAELIAARGRVGQP